jgi:ABC-2 type transport system ATP-binding protein
MTTLLTTHYLDEAERLCDRIAIVHAGQIVAMDTPATLLGQLGAEILELRVTSDPQAALAALRSRHVAGDDAFNVGTTLTIPLHTITARDAVGAVTDLGLSTSTITTRPPTLDDVYLRLTGARLAA